MSKKMPPLPLDDQSEDPGAIENELEREGPHNDRRDRYSREYSAMANRSIGDTEPEMDIVPDGLENYPEKDDLIRARGENPEGSPVVEGDSDEAPVSETPDSEGYASDWKGSEAASRKAAPRPNPSESEDIEDNERQMGHISPTNPDLPWGR